MRKQIRGVPMERNSNCWYINTCDEDCDRCTTYVQMKWQMEHSGLPEAKQRPISLYLTDDNSGDKKAFYRLADIRKNIVDFVQSGKNLYLCSKWTGNGKTSWAVKMLHTYFHYTAVGNYENLKGMFVSTPGLLLKLKDFNNPVSKTFRDNLENVDLVIWDDIAVSGISQYDYTQIFTLIDSRIFAEKSNIFTSNQTTVEGFASVLGDRLASRIYYTSEIIELKGKDMR
jgi:DNA replication protein DnaC